MKTILSMLAILFFPVAPVYASTEISPTVKYQKQNSQMIAYMADIFLSGDGAWKIQGVGSTDFNNEIYLLPGKATLKNERDKRPKKIVDEQANLSGRSALRRFYRPIVEYAHQHDNTSPTSITDFDPEKYRYLYRTNESMWKSHADSSGAGSYVFLVPGVKLNIDGKTKQVKPGNLKILAFELRPFLDDGKHWVLYSDGSCSRDDIDIQLIARHGQIIQPVSPKSTGSAPKQTEPRQYILTTLLPEEVTAPLQITLVNSPSSQEKKITWDFIHSENGDHVVLEELNRGRMHQWRPYLMNAASSPTLQAWIQTSGSNSPANMLSSTQRGQRQNRQLSLFSCLGGRSAVEETLQLQELASAEIPDQGQTIPVDTIQGVEVTSHPFEEMAGVQKKPDLPLARLSPHDHFFVYAPRPQAILPFLDSGASFIAELGGIVQSTGIKYELKKKYLQRLGLDSLWLKKFIDSGAISETAFIFPDLFFIDGTDVTVVSRLASKGLFGSLVKLVGITGLSGNNIVTRILPDNQKVFWALREDLLIISSNRNEMETVLTLHQNQGAGSLGQSAEFRYMLTKLSLTDTTSLYGYFSDPFIRKLVGPETKIAQRRRLVARRDLEQITSSALLARLDGLKDPTSFQSLVSYGYLPERMNTGEYDLKTNFQALSKNYGTIASLKTLNEVPVTNATPAEAKAYKQYVVNYNRYWRKYFDPIAIRIEDQPGGYIEASVYILPLIESTIYSALRNILASGEDKTELKVPEPSPKPVSMLSLNLQEDEWLKIIRDYLRIFQRYTHISPAFFDDLGPGLHLAIQDGDPVIALGSGDILGAFNADTAGLFRGSGAFLIPASLSLLTRPCSLYIETSNPEQTKKYLQRATSVSSQSMGRFEGPSVDFYQVDGRDEWVYSFDLFGLVKLRYAVEIQDRYVVIRNIPWFQKEIIERVRHADLNGALLETYPQASELQLPGLFASAQENKRKAARASMAYLYPILASGQGTVKDAVDEHFRLYGFRPAHPSGGMWKWLNRTLSSSLYGSATHQVQPTYMPNGQKSGLLRDIESLSLNMQFEDAGLRSKIRWKLNNLDP